MHIRLTMNLNSIHLLCCTAALAFFALLLLPGAATSATAHFSGQGISFDYPEKFTLTEKAKKHAQVITLKAGWDVIEVRVMANPLFDGYAEVVMKALDKKFTSMGWGISDVKQERKSIPLRVKGESSPVDVEAVKCNQTIGVVKGDVRFNLLQTLFFFSYGEHGYSVDFRRAKGKYSDLVTLLSSFTFAKKEAEEDTAKAGLY